MIIKNLTKNIIISQNAAEALTLWQKAFGLIFHKKPSTMFFHTRFGIHTYFMPFPIDVIILENNNQVYKLKKTLKPFNIFFWNPKFSTVIELPAGTIESSNTEPGDIIGII